MALALPPFVLPGDVLGLISQYSAGAGAYADGPSGHIRASLAGSPRLEQGGATLSVQRGGGGAGAGAVAVPEVGQLVLARVLRISPLAAHCEVVLCEGKPTGAFSGVLLREHVTPGGAADAPPMEDCVRPGDVVQAVVASLGDARSFFLSTAPLHCGVVAAKAEVSGLPLRAVDYKLMEDAGGARERRKVARVEDLAEGAGAGAGGGATAV